MEATQGSPAGYKVGVDSEILSSRPNGIVCNNHDLFGDLSQYRQLPVDDALASDKEVALDHPTQASSLAPRDDRRGSHNRT